MQLWPDLIFCFVPRRLVTRPFEPFFDLNQNNIMTLHTLCHALFLYCQILCKTNDNDADDDDDVAKKKLANTASVSVTDDCGVCDVYHHRHHHHHCYQHHHRRHCHHLTNEYRLSVLRTAECVQTCIHKDT